MKMTGDYTQLMSDRKGYQVIKRDDTRFEVWKGAGILHVFRTNDEAENQANKLREQV